MLRGIFSTDDESQRPDNDVSQSPRTIALKELQVQEAFFQTWNDMNQQYIKNAEKIAALKQQHETESSSLDHDAADELWKTSFLPYVNELEDAQAVLEETRKKLEAETLKKINDFVCRLREHAYKSAEAMDAAMSKVDRIEIMCNNGESQIIGRIEPVKYFSDLEAKGLAFCPESKISFLVSGSKNMVGSQEELRYAYADVDSSRILKLDMGIEERNVSNRKRKYDDYSADLSNSSGPKGRSEVLRFKEDVQLCVLGEGQGVADVVKTRSVESARTFSRGSRGLQFKSTQVPHRLSVYSDIAKACEQVSRGLLDVNDQCGNENEREESTQVHQRLSVYSDMAKAFEQVSRGLLDINDQCGDENEPEESTQVPHRLSVLSDMAKAFEQVSRGLLDINDQCGDELDPVSIAEEDFDNLSSAGSSEKEILTSTENANVNR